MGLRSSPPDSAQPSPAQLSLRQGELWESDRCQSLLLSTVSALINPVHPHPHYQESIWQRTHSPSNTHMSSLKFLVQTIKTKSHLFSVLCVLKTECSFSLSFMRSRIYTTLQSQLQWDAYPLLYSYNEISTAQQLQWDIYCSSVTLRCIPTALQLQWDIHFSTVTVRYLLLFSYTEMGIHFSTITVRYLLHDTYSDILYLLLYTYSEISTALQLHWDI